MINFFNVDNFITKNVDFFEILDYYYFINISLNVIMIIKVDINFSLVQIYYYFKFHIADV